MAGWKGLEAMLNKCDHKYIFIESKKKTEEGSYQIGWKRVDRFYCERCLEQREVVKEEWSREAPAWW